MTTGVTSSWRAMIIYFLGLAAGLFVEELIYLSCRLCINSGHLGEIRQACPLDRFHSAKMTEQLPLPRGADPRNFLQAGLADGFFSTGAMRADSEAVGFIAQALHEIEQGVAGRQPERVASCHEKCFSPRVAV